MIAKALLPPQYVNVSAAVTYSDELSATHFRTYVRLVGLAWRDEEHTRLPPLSLAELAALCHLKSRVMRLHLKALVQEGLLTIQGASRAYRIQVQEPEGTTASFSEPLMPRAAADQPAERAVTTAPPSAAVQANLDALATFGVRPTVAQARRAAALPHVTPDLIRAWGNELQSRPSVRNLPGLLLYQLSTTKQPPVPERRGGARPAPQDTTATPLPEPETAVSPVLPDAIRSGLHNLGWSGPTTEVAQAYAAEPARVAGLLTHWQAADDPTIKSRAALFRAALRAGSWPPPIPEAEETSGRRYIEGPYAAFIQH
ncbi:MAG: hypothetical protein U9Q70_11000 [Chloroflexota bacterium]|nr:hypothetical protein [Chloroflexota bacterium]